MSFVAQVVVGVGLVVVGAVVALGFADAELLWFRGRPLGVVLGILGLVDIGEALLRRRGPDSLR
ncbi:hypothetical protein [Nocardioides dongkuii]|uniref:hypothetical protein n=1 Tax=Nocardioides dongkuii TaxID=2760089 RepID=UPI0015F814BA|nr:hypothetical protein [Nocardioides dongkuii]